MNLAKYFPKIAQYGSSIQASVFFLIFCLLMTVWVRKNGFEGYQFGQEIGNVSAALADGEGFSNVFDLDSGPTAWTPMFFTSIYGAIFKIFGTKSVYSYWALFLLRCVMLAATFHLAARIDYGETVNKYKFLLLPIFLVFAYFVILKRGMDDVVFNVFLSMILIYVSSKIFSNGFRKVKAILYLLALIIPLANISFFIALFGFITLTQFSLQLPQIPRKHAVALLLIMMMTMSAWGLRNRSTLNQFIPFKSNLWFELYLANVKDDDGILKYTNFREYHPLSNSDVKERYETLGETKFMEKYKNASLDYLSENSADFLEKAFNRAMSIFVWTQFNINNVAPVAIELEEEDIDKLEAHSLILNGEWICIDLSPKAFESKISALNLTNQVTVLEDWTAKRKQSKKAKLKLNNLVVGFLMSALPSMALIICLLTPAVRRNRLFLVTLILFLITIGPYLIISFHTRYQLFQMSFFVIFVFFALATLIERFLPGLVDKQLSADTPSS